MGRDQLLNEMILIARMDIEEADKRNRLQTIGEKLRSLQFREIKKENLRLKSYETNSKSYKQHG